MSPTTFDDILAMNLRGVFLTCRYVAPHILAHKYGLIIDISSQLALKGGLSMAHYTAAKTGILGLTRSKTIELTPRNIPTNVIAPDPIMAPLLADVSDDWVIGLQAALPLGRFDTVEEVAPTALLLAASSSFCSRAR